MIRVTKDNFPSIFDAMLEIELDNGAHHVNRICGADTIDLDGFNVPDPFEHLVAPAAAGLARLKEQSADDLETFLCGEEGDQHRIRDRQGDLAEAHELLNAWFNDWQRAKAGEP